MAKANAYVVVSYVQNKLQAHGSQTRNTKALKDFLLFFFFAEGLCVVWMGQLPHLYPLRLCSYTYAYMYVFLTW